MRALKAHACDTDSVQGMVFLLAFSFLCFSSFIFPLAHALLSPDISLPVAVNTHSSSDARLDGAPALAYFPAGAWAGSLVCSWASEDAIPGYQGWNIFSAYSDDHGSSWSPALLLSDHGAGTEGLQEGLPKIDARQQHRSLNLDVLSVPVV